MSQTILLRDICRKVISGGTPLTSKQEYYDGDTPWLRTHEINFGRIYSTEKTITEAGLKNSSAKLVPKNSVIVAMYGATAGRVAINKISLATNQACCNLIVDPQKANYEYVYYYLLNNYDMLLNAATGAAQQNLGARQIAGMSINLPDLDIQNERANFLSTLDKKIELNKKMNETLEKIGQAFFRHYFIADPDAQRWPEIKIGEIVNIKGGGTPSTKNPEFWNGKIAWTSPRDLTGKDSIFLLDTDKKITKDGLTKVSSGLLPEGTLLLSSRAPIGYIAITGLPMAINQGYIAFLPDTKLSNFFMYFWLKQNMERIKGAANGSTFMEISKSAFRKIILRMPSNDRLKDFDQSVQGVFNMLRTNQEEIQTLSALRDILLPRLISGKIKV